MTERGRQPQAVTGPMQEIGAAGLSPMGTEQPLFLPIAFDMTLLLIVQELSATLLQQELIDMISMELIRLYLQVRQQLK